MSFIKGCVLMAMDAGVKCRVIFPAEKAEVTVPKGKTVLEACTLAGIEIDSVCGGEGKCGRCKVRPSGEFSADKSSLVTGEEQKDGVTLACITRVNGDMSVEIMPRSRIRRHQILTRSMEQMPATVSPWVSKEYLELPPATISDNLADLERLLRGLRRKELCMPLDTLRELPRAMRSGGWKVTATLTDLESTREITAVEPGNTAGSLLGLAVDIGTTTIVTELVDLETGKILETASDYNHQTSRGEDVIARMMFAEDRGGKELRLLARETINQLIDRMVRQLSAKVHKRPSRTDISAVTIACNTVMANLFTGIDTTYIRLEPYVPASYSLPCAKAGELGLSVNPSARVMMFPARAGYVGGDVVADVLASGMHASDGLSLLIDVGTNGEIVLGGKDWMVSCSCSAGPAFEGGEVSCGMRAMEGAIDKIRINDDYSTAYHVLGEGDPMGICGSGLIDLVAEMYLKGIIDRKARIQDVSSPRVVVSDSESRYIVELKAKLGTRTRNDLTVTEADLQNLLRTKAAIYGACSVLMNKTEVSWDKLDSVIIAGGFGYHIDIERAITIGMFPDLPREKYRFIGNGSLGGARLALVSAKSRKEVSRIFEKMTYIELSTDNEFYNEFSSSLFIPHTEIARFPSQGGA